MTRRALPALLVFALCAAAAEPDGSVAAKLAKAKDTYVVETAKYQEAVLAYLAARETNARKDGNKKLVDQIKAERNAFTAKGTSPTLLSATLKQRQAAIKTAIEIAYSAAIKDYTRTKLDDDAAFVEKEFKRLQTTGSFFPPQWTEAFPPGDYQVKYQNGNSSRNTFKEDGTYSRKSIGGANSATSGKLEYRDGKLVLRAAGSRYVEEWTREKDSIRVRHFPYTSRYPEGSFENGTAGPVEKK